MSAQRKAKREPEDLDVSSYVKKLGVNDLLFNNDAGTENNSPSITIPLESIKERDVNTRNVTEEHVAALQESIAALGLIEPIVVDTKFQLLAGAHRLAAIQLLKREQADIYRQHFPQDAVPVRIMPFDADEDPNKALECEVAENEHRRDYTAKEVRGLAERLKAAGYLTKRGRRREGEMHLVPALQVIVGKSRRTLMRYLSEDENKSNVPNDIFEKQRKNMEKLRRDLKAVRNMELGAVENPKIQAFNKQLPKFMKLLEAALKEIEVERNS